MADICQLARARDSVHLDKRVHQGQTMSSWSESAATGFAHLSTLKPITLEDIESVDPTLHKGLTWMLDNDIDAGLDGDQDSKVIDTTFSVEHEAFGVVRTHELKKGGKNIPVSHS